MKKYIVESPDSGLGFFVLNSLKDNKCLFSGRTLDVCRSYLDGKGFDYDIVRYGSFIPSVFLDDLEKKCDVILAKAISIAKFHSCRFRHNIIYNDSAAFMGGKIHYCYESDFGDLAYILYDDIDDETDKNIIRSCMNKLYGISLGLWELGFQLTFDSDHNHSIMRRCSGNYLEVELSDVEGV